MFYMLQIKYEKKTFVSLALLSLVLIKQRVYLLI